MPELSVVIPVYKVEKYLPDCVESVLAQSFRDLEIILVDDGSPDNCGRLCDEYAARDARVRVIHQKNQGLSQARNVGLDASHGEYLCFIDSDDMISPLYCERLLSMLRGTDCLFSVCGVLRFSDGTDPQTRSMKGKNSFLSTDEYLEAQLDRKTEFGVWNKIFSRHVFESIRFFPGKIHEDVILSADLLSLHGKAVMTDQPLYYYRQRDTGIVAESRNKCSPDRVFAGEYLVNSAKEHCPRLFEKCLTYAVSFPWSFVDRIYVDRTFHENKEFLSAIHLALKNHLHDIQRLNEIDGIIKNRMSLFVKSPILYGANAYSRLLRVYAFHLIGKDAYTDGHGI